jgi:hypothetical protein
MKRKGGKMVKRVSVFSLLQGTNADEFWKWHTEVHASDFKRVAGSRLKKYVISRVTNVVLGEPEFWGMVETWYESEEIMNEVYKDTEPIKTPEGKTFLDDWWSRVTGGFVATMYEKEITL